MIHALIFVEKCIRGKLKVKKKKDQKNTEVKIMDMEH